MTSLRSLLAAARARPVITGLLVIITLFGGYKRFDAIGTSTRVSIDEHAYLGLANRMIAHRGYRYGKNPLHWAPGTPYLFATVMRLTGTGKINSRVVGASNPALYAQAVVGTLTIIVVFALAAWLGGAIPGLVAAGFCAVYDPLILVARSYLSEPLGGFFFVLALLAIVIAVSTVAGRKRWACGAGFLLGCAVLSRNDLLPLFAVLPALAFLMVWKRESPGAGLRLALLLLASAVITVTPWVAQASHRRQKFTPITTAGPSSLWVATYLPAGGRQILLKRQFSAEVCRTFPTQGDACNVTATRLDMRLIFKLLAKRHPTKTQAEAISLEVNANLKEDFSHPVKFAGMLATKFGRIWFAPWGGGGVGKQQSSRWQHRVLIGISAIGMLAGLFLAGRRRRYVLLGFASLVTVTALNTVFVSEARMSLRMDPLLFAIGIGAIGAIWRARNGHDEVLIAPPEPEKNAADRAGMPDPPPGPHDALGNARAPEAAKSQRNPIQTEPRRTDTGDVTSATSPPLLHDARPKAGGSS